MLFQNASLPKQLAKFELMNLIHNHWSKSSEARNRDISRARLRAGKITRNQDEQGQFSWGLGSCCLSCCRYIFIGLGATEIPTCFTLVVPGWIGVPMTRWMFLFFFPAWHCNEPNVKSFSPFFDFRSFLPC